MPHRNIYDNPPNTLTTGAQYFVQGINLLWHPQLRVYILIPLLVNCILFVALTTVFIGYFNYWAEIITGSIEVDMGWFTSIIVWVLKALAWFGLIVLGVILLMVYGYSFNVITNIIAAPFYGLLAEKTEMLITGKKGEGEPLAQMIPRVIGRAISKLWYFLSRGFVIMLIVLLLSPIPLINLIAPFIGLLWSAWSMAIQYGDYAADNNRLDFKELRQRLWQKKYSSLGFGGIVMGCSVVPILNIFAMPAAVTGGTIYWVKELRDNAPKQ